MQRKHNKRDKILYAQIDFKSGYQIQKESTFDLKMLSFIISFKTVVSLSTNRLALTRFKARSCLVNDIHAALATNKFAVAMTSLKRLKRILDFHVHHRSGYGPLPGFTITSTIKC